MSNQLGDARPHLCITCGCVHKTETQDCFDALKDHAEKAEARVKDLEEWKKKAEARVAKLEATLDRLDGLIEFLAVDEHDDSRLEVHKFLADSLLRNLQNTIWEVKK
jgi:hypothetical protein